MGFEQDVMDAVKKAVEDAGNVRALAHLCGLNPSTVFRWTQGTRDPTLSGLAKIMDYIGVTVQKPDAEPAPPPPGGLARSIYDTRQQELARENARLEGQVELLKELLGAPPKKEKNAG